ncbi:hypothetical protein [Agrobacterium tumefaciens]|uniref:hypothetical protein n=1 Tax=Agrobacterium tumefaciens TaxID=358 RepID=UPI0015736DBA|nr:hypothetical protein [Agrobacterium tumefaciens]NTA19304.1 hypothetical protein [Agrobacterium tumefaciens]WCK74794.1 hypothetical protein G6L96_025365 [Agrobacterium tumefaciens]
MASNEVALWKADNVSVMLDQVSDPLQIASHALQLRDRERNQIASNIADGNFEVASTYVWTRTMALLKRQLSSLGAEFIGELLQRPEIDEFTDVATAISDSEAISLALDLGVISPLQSKRLFHSLEIVTYFSGLSTNDDFGREEEIMTLEDAVACLRVCVQGVLGHEKVGAAEDFKRFRDNLSSSTFTLDSPELNRLRGSPYFFIRTAISVLLSLIRSTKGAQLEHTARNALLIIPELWPALKQPERWQIGQVYAEEYNEGRRESLKGLHSVLLKVSGFDYVPENLRSSTFIKVATSVIAAHEGHDNFYNEPAPIRELASLGTSIPGPALATCMTAALCVKLGNRWGISRAAQPAADQILAGISVDRWVHYLDGRLEEDRRILSKLTESGPRTRWIALIATLDVESSDVKSKNVKRLLKATIDGHTSKINELSGAMYRESLGLK